MMFFFFLKLRLAEQPVGSWVGVCRHMESSDKWSVMPAESCSLGGSSSCLPLPHGSALGPAQSWNFGTKSPGDFPEMLIRMVLTEIHIQRSSWREIMWWEMLGWAPPCPLWKPWGKMDYPEEMAVLWEHCCQGCDSHNLDRGKGCLDSQGQHYAFIGK